MLIYMYTKICKARVCKIIIRNIEPKVGDNLLTNEWEKCMIELSDLYKMRLFQKKFKITNIKKL